MNSNSVYASVCRNGDGTTAYGTAGSYNGQVGGAVSGPTSGTDLSAAQVYYHQQTSDRLVQPSGPPYLTTTLMTPYSSGPDPRTPPLHSDSANGHQIISESNGLSYTNLDQSHSHYPSPHHHSHQQQRVAHPHPGNPTHTFHHHHYSAVADVAPRPTHGTYHPYRNLDYDLSGHSVHQTSEHGHPQSMTIGPEGARVVPGFGVNPTTYPYLDTLSLSRRNGYGGYENYDPALRESCQVNGGYQCGSAVHRNRVATTQPTPVPTYKWMQVKRSVPKPGKHFDFIKLFLR